jgi:hypothetical protein
MLARLDNLPQRRCSVTPHAAAPDVDFRTSMRCKRIPGRHDPCSRNFPSHACHAKPRPLAYRLRKLRELQDPGSGRSALGLAIGITLAETAETPAMARPMPRQARGQGGKVGKPIFRALLRYESIPGVANGKKNGTTVVQLDSSSTVWRANGNWRTWFYGARLLREAVAKPREQSENSLSFQCGKAANPGQWCLLIPAFCVPKF